MAILQLIAEEEKSLCFDFLEEKIREESRKLIESIYADEVNQFLEKMASIVDGKGNKLVVRNGYNELLCQHKKIHRFKVYKLYSLFVFQFIALEGFIHFIRYTVI